MVESVNINTTQFKGLIEALDPRQLAEIGILDGANFLLDAEGPYSAFGSNLITHQKISAPRNNRTFRVGADIFQFTTGAVLAYDSTAGYYYPVFTFTDSGDVAPWFHAIVGGNHYFARMGVGLLRYIVSTAAWSTLSGGSIPVGVVSVAESGDRLIVLGTSVVAWSAISDGADMVTNISTGAGFQPLTLIGGGDAWGVYAVTDGFISITNRGSMKSTSVDSAIPFRHDAMDIESHVPINPFCAISIGNDRLIFLTRAGLVETAGEHPMPWQPLMGEYLVRKIIPNLDLTKKGILKLHYDLDRQWFIISVGTNSDPQIYTYAKVLYIPRDEWGEFNHTHSAFGELNIAEGSAAGFNFGYIGEDGCVHSFNDLNRVQANDDFTEYDGVRHLIHQIPGRYEENNLIGSMNVNLTAFDRNQYPELYDIYPNFLAVQQSINAYIDIGAFRATDGKESDVVSQIDDIAVGMNLSVVVETEDYNLGTGVEDYNSDTGVEDYGFNFIADVEYGVRITPTLDGVTPYKNQQLTAMLIEEVDGVKFFDTGSSLGIYHIIRISAQAVNESFHLKLLNTTAKLVGNL